MKKSKPGKAQVMAYSNQGRRISKGRLLWIGDALVPTGFATVTHSVLRHLQSDWDVTVSGINYDGAPHLLPYDVMPAWQGGDMWGMDRFPQVIDQLAPDVVVINNDWWNVAKFVEIAPAGTRIVGYMPVDGRGLAQASMRSLNRASAAVWYTDFGHREAVAAGFNAARHVVSHGIDVGFFKPSDRAAARKKLGLDLPKNAFVVGNVNRNQPRKRLDVTIQIFANWIKAHRIKDAYLVLHCAKKDAGWDLQRVAEFFGVADRLIITGGDEIRGMQGADTLRLVYNSLDVQMTTTLGEGWGLTTMEGMACGVPQIVPDAAALGEWPVPAVKVPCSRLLVNPEINTVGALVDDEPFVAALQSLYVSPARRAKLSAESLAHVRQEQFSWSSVARQFDGILSSVLKAPAMRKSSKRSRMAFA